MDNRILAIYDIIGIQKYIYQTSKLKDIVGASSLVRSALNDMLLSVATDLNISCDDFILYSGGGNAILKFTSIEQWRIFNSAFSKKLLIETPGLSFATHYDDTEHELPDRIENLFTGVAKKKYLAGDDCLIYTLPPMAQSTFDQLPVSVIDISQQDKGDYSSATWAKRREGKKLTSRSIDAREFDDIVKKPDGYEAAENMMAVVHIDGNNMGKIIKHICEEKPEEIVTYSKNISELFETALNKIWENIPKKSKRMIYQNGDDTTYVCNCVFALDSVLEFADYISSKRTGLLKELSVSAGIAYVKPHFPFYKAYDIAEACCSNAKKRARSESGNIDIGNWVDFEIVRGNKGTDIISHRKIRPYNIKGNSLKYDIEKLERIINEIQKGEIARSKWKSLRNAYLTGNEERVKRLIESLKNNETLQDEDGCIFDALDIVDILGVKKVEMKEMGAGI